MAHGGGSSRPCDVSHADAPAYAGSGRVRASGLALQVVVAGAVVLVLRGAEGVARRLAGALRRPDMFPARAQSWSLPAGAPLLATWVARVDPRGPPLLART